MKKYLSATIICSLLFFLFSCSPSVCPPKTELLRSSFQCEISWRADGYDLRASIIREKESFSLSLLSPPENSGLCVSGKAGDLSLCVDGVKVGSPPLFYRYISELFLSRESFDLLSVSQIGTSKVLCYSRGDAVWYFSAENGRPLRVDSGSDSFEIIWIEGLTQNENTDADRQNGARRS